MLPMRIGLWCCKWELGFDIANENCCGFESWALVMDLNSIDKIVLPWTWIMGFPNISKHKYSWALNIIRCNKKKYLNNNQCDRLWIGFASCSVIMAPPKVKWNIAPIQLTLFSTSLIHLCNLATVIKICFLRRYTFVGVTNYKYGL